MNNRMCRAVVAKIVPVLIVLSVTSCESRQSITVFDQPVAVDGGILHSGHDSRFLKVTGLRSLNYTLSSEVSTDSMAQLIDILVPTQTSLDKEADVIFAYVYTTNAKRESTAIQRSNTHAISLVLSQNGGLAHLYFEKQNDGAFIQITPLSGALDGLPRMDEIRMLHFAAVRGMSLPGDSTIFEFRAQKFDELNLTQSPNRALMTTLLLDSTRNSGSPTVGLYGDALYAAMADDNVPGTGSCGNAQLCPPGGAGTCQPVPSRDGAGYMCVSGDGGGGGGCTAAQLPALSQTLGLNLMVPVDFRAIHEFRDGFLARTENGRLYSSYMYVFSQYAKMDPKSLSQYAAILAPLQDSIRTLMSGLNEDIVVSLSLKEQALAIIDTHKDIDSAPLQKILSRMEGDLGQLSGLNKEQFISAFEARPVE